MTHPAPDQAPSCPPSSHDASSQALHKPPSNPIDCLFATILGVLLPFHLAAAGADPGLTRAAIIQLIDAYQSATAAELDQVGRMLGFSAAAMDNLRLSMRSGLSDRTVLQYRANAVALSRIAEQCRKTLEVMQSKREQTGETAPMPHPQPMPVSKPAPFAPLPPAAPPPSTPPAQPQAAARAVSAVEGDPEFATDIGSMQRNTRAMLADLQMMMRDLASEAPASPDTPIVPERSPPNLGDNAAA
jgi:hypothetical protein